MFGTTTRIPPPFFPPDAGWRGELPAPHFTALKFLSCMLAFKNGRALVVSLWFMGAKGLGYFILLKPCL